VFKIAKEEIFIAGCNPSEADEKGHFVCQPKLIDKEGRTWKGERPMKVKLERGRIVILDDGDTPANVVKRLIKYLEETSLE